jgi:hypothetical protein
VSVFSILSILKKDGTFVVGEIWLVGFASLLALTYIFKDEEPSKEESDNSNLQLMRKSFHFLLICMLMPAGFYNV